MSYLLFVWSPAGYAIREVDGELPHLGQELEEMGHTIGGIRVDERARVLDDAGTPLSGLWAAGVDAGGVAAGGYASGLAQALVLGLAAAEDAAS